ncbi:HAD family hydrolase [Methylomarinum sp. Ch1-1]|uniref:HAD family hydrolase n=1 Tax=Methylomarinum roseum TaxID=3067653 RepID=A0AAU7NZ78_9GAMM|nr:HAD family hydrolase [Methylomarinum sp. Ch1-1]MDP4521579.1 HAD family hydrolase [Methylomarinum sp. Ch1-1]
MEQPVIYALDFDGVICDSAIETGIAGWKAATHIWDDMTTPLPTPERVEQFRSVRPIIETGYEAILVMRLLFNGDSVNAILADFPNKKQQLLMQYRLSSANLKQLFGAVRDQWIKESPDEWVNMNPLFSGIAEKLQRLSTQGVWYIITTKQERFVSEILSANHISLAKSRIFGLDRKMSKEEVLTALQQQHQQQRLYFVEDRLPTLLKVLQNDRLQQIKLFFADWGYNTDEDKLEAARHPLSTIALENFLA